MTIHTTKGDMITPAEYWWNHLSYLQREFILSRIKLGNTNIHTPIHAIAFTEKRWADKEGWPADVYNTQDHLPLL